MHLENQGGVAQAYLTSKKEDIAANGQREINGASSGCDSGEA